MRRKYVVGQRLPIRKGQNIEALTAEHSQLCLQSQRYLAVGHYRQHQTTVASGSGNQQGGASAV